jgi:hypothetical protein
VRIDHGDVAKTDDFQYGFSAATHAINVMDTQTESASGHDS